MMSPLSAKPSFVKYLGPTARKALFAPVFLQTFELICKLCLHFFTHYIILGSTCRFWVTYSDRAVNLSILIIVQSRLPLPYHLIITTCKANTAD